MKAETLRKSILQFAIQGKLVPQIDTEEPASVLLERIKAEKDKLIKQGKIKKEKPLPPITDDEKPFDIPDSWAWVRFDGVAILFTGDSINAQEKKKKYTNLEEGYNYIATKDVGFDNLIDYENGVKIPFNTTFKIAKANSSLLCIEGGSAGRKVGILNQDVCFGNKLCAFEPIIINPIYLFYYLQTPVFMDYFKDNKSGMIGGVGVNTLKTFYIAIPPLREQQRIVSRIDELMILVDEYAKKQVELEKLESEFPEKLKKSILQYAIQGKLVPQIDTEEPASVLLEKIKAEKAVLIKHGKIKKEKSLPPITDDEKPFDIPDTWEWVRLGTLCDFGQCENIEPKNITEDFWVLDLEDIEKDTGRIIAYKTMKQIKSLSTKHLFYKGDVLYSKLRPYLNKVLVAEKDGCCTSEILPLKFGDNIYSYYAKVFIKSPFFLEYANNCSYGMKMPRLGTEDGKKALLALPPLAEQKRIVARIEELFALVDLIASGKKLKAPKPEPKESISVGKVIPMPVTSGKPEFDVNTLKWAARADSGVSEEDLETAKRQVQAFYDNKD